MYLDQEVIFADGYAPTATGDNICPNTWDSGPLGNLLNTNTGRDLGAGAALYFSALVTTTVTSGGAATVTFELVTDSTVSISSIGVLVATPAIPKASLTATAEVVLGVPRGSAMTSLYKRWLGGDINIGTATLTAGAFQLKLLEIDGAQDRAIYQAGYGVK